MLSRKVLLTVALIVCVTLALIGCSSTKQPDTNGDRHGQNQADNEKINQEEQQALLNEFNALVANDSGDPAALNKFVASNIAKFSPENASELVIQLEKAQQDFLPEFETKFYSDSVTQKFVEAYIAGTDINNMQAVQDEELKQLLAQTKASGYKVDTAEGMFYPIIDYQQYQDYSELVTPDIQAYINLMAVESNNPPAKDAALVVGWDEVLTRALNQEQFINTFSSSAKLADVQKLYGRYVQFCLLGANNTPLFSYEDKKMSTAAKESYAKVLAESKPSKLTEIMHGLLDIAEQNNNQLTTAVENYRNNCFEELGIK
ncbi:hypothetical protein SPSYN_01747 [Sporotomaculum syntrophicum]|uniref:Peptidylprolyl isomerase n=1 Tax=Sporotomaculum syntrophicum TaxID=182264 RepID=A0A9D3AZ77_9FIRM|nr:hypothetical protein [Sporotomaculum syntrophicum]KAF1085604.1 hypothetical protein SPSYN_01747 [Sporotomaculum syntrophicum]